MLNSSSAVVPDVELQCRVVAKWPGLSTLLVDIVPWCLLINNTAAHAFVRDLGREVTLELPAGAVVAPHRFKVCVSGWRGLSEISNIIESWR